MQIKSQFNFNDKRLTYFLSCKICGLQYLGSTEDPFFYCWNNYKDNNRKVGRGTEHMQTGLFEYFASRGHNGCLKDCATTLTDKTDGADPTRKEEH